MEERLRGEIFDSLKTALRKRGLTYADLAARMDLSEPTIKRLFSDRDCKMGRLLALCDHAGVSLGDLLDHARRHAPAPLDLPPAVEAELAATPRLFHLFILLRDGVPEVEIMDCIGLSRAEMVRLQLRLEHLGLARTGADGRIRVLSDLPVRFRRHGPLHALIRDINTQFVAKVYDRADADDARFRTLSRRMRPETARLAQQELSALCDRIDTMARQDQLIAADADLRTYKISAAFGPIHFPDVLAPPDKA